MRISRTLSAERPSVKSGEIRSGDRGDRMRQEAKRQTFTLRGINVYRECNMLRYLNQCSRGRGAWLLLALTALALELTALFFQHVMGLKPCVMCIYERNALFGVQAL